MDQKPQMKKLLLLVMLLTTPAMVASTISKQDIIQTIEHERKLAHQAEDAAKQAKEELVAIQATLDSKDAEISKQAQQIKSISASRDYWKRVAERLLFALSLTAGIIAGLVFFQFSTIIITRIYPPALPFSILISIAVGAITFGSVWAALVHL
jgi:hypothetical protein